MNEKQINKKVKGKINRNYKGGEYKQLCYKVFFIFLGRLLYGKRLNIFICIKLNIFLG